MAELEGRAMPRKSSSTAPEGRVPSYLPPATTATQPKEATLDPWLLAAIMLAEQHGRGLARGFIAKRSELVHSDWLGLDDLGMAATDPGSQEKNRAR
jgi:hypothetical protein